jgi:hypothetical protein
MAELHRRLPRRRRGSPPGRHAGSATALGRDISLRRLEQAGITLTTTAAVSAELAGDYPTHSRIMHGG